MLQAAAQRSLLVISVLITPDANDACIARQKLRQPSIRVARAAATSLIFLPPPPPAFPFLSRVPLSFFFAEETRADAAFERSLFSFLSFFFFFLRPSKLGCRYPIQRHGGGVVTHEDAGILEYVTRVTPTRPHARGRQEILLEFLPVALPFSLAIFQRDEILKLEKLANFCKDR